MSRRASSLQGLPPFPTPFKLLKTMFDTRFNAFKIVWFVGLCLLGFSLVATTQESAFAQRRKGSEQIRGKRPSKQSKTGDGKRGN